MATAKIISCANDLFKLNADALTEEAYAKLPKQCKVLVDILKENNYELTRGDYVEKLIEATQTIVTEGEGENAVEKPRLETGQDVTKILGYYKKPLETAGILTIVKAPKPEAKIKVSKKKQDIKE